MKYRIITVSTLSILTAISAYSQDNQSATRENPVIENILPSQLSEYPDYINLKKNKIRMNSDDWSELSRIMQSASNQRVNVVHIGDSHLQADMGTAVTRSRLGDYYGTGGRGLVVPFRLAGTNQPVDYTVTSEVSMKKSRLLKTPWDTAMGFTGIGIEPDSTFFDISISTSIPFDSVKVYYSGSDLQLVNSDSLHASIAPGLCSIALDSLTKQAQFKFQAPIGTAIHGFDLTRGHIGITYNVIGNNGATFETYNGIPGFASDVARYNPALIILSMGTNEAYNNADGDAVYTQIDTLVNDLRRSCPNAKILLTTPSECQQKKIVRRRRKTRTVYKIHPKVAEMRKVVLRYADDHNLPVYDFYDVAGGKGSSDDWFKDSYLNKDRIHMTRAGYTLQGNLFTDALMKALTNSSQ